jgi:transposase
VRDWESVLAECGKKLRTARNTQATALTLAEHLTTEAVSEGISEKRAAELLGVDRMTVRKWLGKR